MEGRGLQVGQSATPVLRLVSNQEIQEREQKEFDERQSQPQITGLAGYLKSLWESARTAKERVQDEILDDYHARNGKYPEDKLGEIRKFGGSEIYMMLSNEKARAVEANLKDVLAPADDKPWTIEPSPLVDMPEDAQMDAVREVMQEAQRIFDEYGQEVSPEALIERVGQVNEQIKAKLDAEAKHRAGKMEQTIEDQMVDGNWDEAMQEFIYDLSTTKAAILKGPIVKRRKRMEWVQTPQGYKPDVIDGFQLEWERRSPLDIYPSADATNTQNGYLFDRYQFHLDDIQAMRGLKGVDDAALDRVIEQYGRSGYKTIESGDQERAHIEQRQYAYWTGYSTTIEAKQFWGSVPGYILKEWGMEVESDYEIYNIQAWLIGDYVVKATINEDPLGRRPYHKTSFEKLPGSFWGRGPCELIKDHQDMVNALARAIVNNSAMSSGPIVAINDTDRLQADEDPTQIYPWRVYQFKTDKLGTAHRPPIEFFQPSPMTESLMNAYQFFSQEADGAIGMPSYPMSDLKNAAGDTASGMSMALNQASKGAKSVIKNCDTDVVEPTVGMTFEFNMLYNPDESIKGDLRPVPRGSTALLLKEHQQMRRQEFLQTTNNPADLQIMGIEGRANLLREAAKSLDIPIEDVVPNLANQELANALMQAPQQPQQGQQLDQAGNPVSGQDTRQFNPRGQGNAI